MRRGVVGGIAACLLVVTSWSAFGVSLRVNDVSVNLASPILIEGGSILVPIIGFGRAIGIETTATDGRLVLRWSGRRRTLESEQQALRDGIGYASLEWLVGLVGGDIHRVGDVCFVETVPAVLSELEAQPDRITLRFSAFAPHTIETSQDGTERVLTFHHSRTDVDPQPIVLGESGFRRVRLPSGASGRVRVEIAIEAGVALNTRSYESSGFYSISFETGEHEKRESIFRTDDDLVLCELEQEAPNGGFHANWVYVEGWHDRYRLVPTFPSTGHRTLAAVDELMRESGAAAAIGIGCVRAEELSSLLVIDELPYALPDEPMAGLGLDLFGWWTYISGEASAVATHRGVGIDIDDVNRPLRYGEVIAYAPGYIGTIARGVLGSFLVIKIRSDRVVSVFEGPFVTPDATATLLVASGEAKARLSLLALGDCVSIECSVGANEETFAHAFTAGPVLFDSGAVPEGPEEPLARSPGGWNVLATDWHGGLFLLSFERKAGRTEETAAQVVSLLRSMSVPIRDAIVLGRCAEPALAARDATSTYVFGSNAPHGLALCLVPLAP